MPPKKLRLILAYHRVNDAADLPINLRAADFEAQLRRLRDMGFRSVKLSDYQRWYIGGDDAALPDRSVVFTFDDGYCDNFRNDMPLLLKYGFSGAFFIPTAFVGTNRLLNHDAARGGRPEDDRVLTWDEIRAMRDAGMEIGGHTRNHAVLTEVSSDVAWDEIHGCMDDLKQNIGAGKYFFCYPKNFFNAEAVEMVRRAGFVGAVVTPAHNNPAPKGDPFLMRRVGIQRQNPLWQFDFKVRGWYDRFRESAWWGLVMRFRDPHTGNVP